MSTFKSLQKILPRLYSFLPYHFAWKHAFPPAHVFFEVTYRCNLRCDMCHFLEIIEETESGRTFKNEMSASKIIETIDALPRFSLITFTGGEAFMKKDFLQIIDRAVKKHKVHIITNGTLLNQETVEHLIKNRVRHLLGSGVFYLGVSLEGNEKEHDRITTVDNSFAKTTAGLKRLVDARGDHKYPLIHLTCVIGLGNVHELDSLYDYAQKLNVDVCNFVLNNPAEYHHSKDYDQEVHLDSPPPPVEEIPETVLRPVLENLVEKSMGSKTQLRFSPNYLTVDEIVRYYENKSSYQEYRCYVPWAKAAVTAYGDTFSCPHMRMENVLPTEGRLPWQSEKIKAFRQRLKKEKIFPGCLGCCQSEYVGKN